MKIVPLGNRLLIQPLEGEKETKSGIILASRNAEAQDCGMILDAGPQVEDARLTAGVKVLFKKYTADETTTGTEKRKCVFIEEQDVLAFIDDESEAV